MRVWLPLILILASTVPAASGPWPRDEGAWFLSLSHSTRADPATVYTPAFSMEGYTALYAEYGLGPRLTLGFDAGVSDGGDVTAFGFLRRPVGPSDRPLRLSWHAGAGLTGPPDDAEPLVVLGGSAGRGFQSRWGDGWLTLDTALHYRTTSGDIAVKADATAGLKPRPGHMAILQLQTGAYPGSDPYIRLAPSYVREIAKGRFVELGGDIGLVGDTKAGIKAGIWFEF